MLVPQTEITINLDGVELARTVLEPGGYVIGADPASDIVAKADGLARYHAHLTVTPDELRVQDLGSEKGTFVAGTFAAEATRFWPNQKVLLGPAVLEARRLRSSSADQSLPAPAVAVRRILPEEFLRHRKYEIAGTLGQGGMGAVLRAHEATTHRTVAMKVMLANISEADVVRFIAEAQITSQLEHPNIVPVHELGVDEHNQVFYTMKLVQGVTLRAVLDRLRAGDVQTQASYPLRRLLVVLTRVCDAMAFAHSRGVIHRDLKPENVMIGDFGEVLVMDWGLAKVLGMPETAVSAVAAATAAHEIVSSARSSEADSFTRVGAFVGTPHYMSPEQARGETETLDARADVWALGGLLHGMLSLTQPVRGETADEIMANVRAGLLEPIPEEAPHCPGGRVPEALVAVARKAQAMDRESRYASAAEFRHEIEAYLGGFATSAERAGTLRQIWLLMGRHRAVSVVLLLLLIVSIGFVVRLMASERRASQNAQAAQDSEALARRKEKAAYTAEAVALQEKEAARRALARSQISLADGAFRESNSAAMIAALDSVPEDLRDSAWRYLRPRADNSQAKIEVRNGAWYIGAAAHPKRAGVFAVAGLGGQIALVDGKTGQWLSNFQAIEKQRRNVWSRGLDFSPDGERLAVGTMGDGGVAIYRVSDGQCLVQWEGTGVDTVQFNAAGDQLLTVDDQRGLLIRDASSGEVRWGFPACLRAAWAPGGKAVVAQGGTLRVIDPQTHQAERDLYIGRELITSITMPLGAKTLYFGSSDGMVHGLDFADGKVVFEERLTERGGWLRVSSAGRYLAATTGAADRYRAVQAWDTQSGQPLHPLLGGASNVEGLAIHPLSDDILVSGVDTRTWNVSTRLPQWTFSGAASSGAFWQEVFFPGIVPVRLEPGGRQSPSLLGWPDLPDALYAGAAGNVAAVGKWRIPNADHAEILVLRRKGGSVAITHTLKTDTHPYTLRLSPEGDRVATLNYYSAMPTWDTTTGERLPACDVNGVRAVNDVAWIGSVRLVGVISTTERGAPGWEERVVLWDANTGRQLQSVLNPTAMDGVAVAPDRRTFAEAGADKNVRLRDAGSLAVTREFRAHDGAIVALAYHPSKPILATASADLTVRLWDLQDSAMIEEIRTPGKEPASLRFDSTGDLLACTDVGGSACVWDLRLSATAAAEQSQQTDRAAGPRERGEARARQCRWREAREAFAALTRLQPEDGQSWYRLAPLLVRLGDHDAYRALCHEMLERFGTTSDPVVMERVAKACLLEPTPDAEMALAVRLGDTAVEKGAGHPARLYFQFAKGLAQYRAGAFAAAAETLRPFQKFAPSGPLDLNARAVLAMALHHDGHQDEARALLSTASEAVPRALPDEGADQSSSWHDFLTARLFLREATETLQEK